MGRPKLDKPPPAVNHEADYLQRNFLRTIIMLNDEGRCFFLDRVQMRPILWDRNHPDFRKTEFRQLALKAIRDDLFTAGYITEQVPLKKIKTTLTLLKGVYRKKKKHGDFEKDAVKYQWMQKMDSFLYDSIKPYEHLPKAGVPTTAGKCTVEEHLSLLHFYKKNEILWNPKHPLYTDRIEVNNAWQPIKEVMKHKNFTVEICKKVIVCLRNRYIKKRKVLRLADVEDYAKNIEWFGLAESFLGPLIFPLKADKLPAALEPKYSQFDAIEDMAAKCEDLEEIGSVSPNLRAMPKDDRYPIYLRFVKIYQHFELLWNYKHPLCKEQLFRAKAWSLFLEKIKVRHITPKDCASIVKRVRGAYILKRKALPPHELEMIFLQPEWFVIAESIWGSSLFKANGEMIDEEEEEQQSRNNDSDSEKEIDVIMDSMKNVENSSVLNRSRRRPQLKKNYGFKPTQTKNLELLPPAPIVVDDAYSGLEKFPNTLQLDNPDHLDEIRLRILKAHKHYEPMWNQDHPLFRKRKWHGTKWWTTIASLVNVEGMTMELAKEKFHATRLQYRMDLLEKFQPDAEWYRFADTYMKKVRGLPRVTTAPQQDEMDSESAPFTPKLKMKDPKHREDIRLRIMTVYKTHELLWNTKHNLYKATPRRHQLWENIFVKVNVQGLTTELLKNEIQVIRKLYKSLVKKKNVRKPPWYYVTDSFLSNARFITDDNRGRNKRSIDSSEVTSSSSKRPKPSTTVIIKEELDIEPDFLPMDIQPEFIATDIIDEIKIEKTDAIILSEPVILTFGCCRSCLQDSQSLDEPLKCLKTTTVDGVSFEKIYNEHIGSAFHDSDHHLPDGICSSCFHTIVNFSVLRQKSLANEKQYLSSRDVHLLEKSKGWQQEPVDVNDTTSNFAGESFQNDFDDNDSFTWEDDIPLGSYKSNQASTSKIQDIIQEKKNVDMKPSSKRSTSIVNATTTTKQEIKDIEPPLDNFDIGEIDFEDFFENNDEEASDNDDNVVEEMNMGPISLKKPGRLIREEGVPWTGRTVKKADPEQEAKKDAMFEDYLKDMLKKAKTNPIIGEKKKNTEPKKYAYDYNTVCTVCGLKVKNLNQHMRMHEKPQNRYCEYCSRKKVFTNSLQLHQHMRRKHRDLYDLIKDCELCGAKFKMRQDRTEHMRTVHSETKCKTCGKVYTNPYHLMVHEHMTHVIERNEDGTPLKCTVCNKDFRNYMLLNQHAKRTHKNNTYECDKCEYTSHHKTCIKRHQLSKHGEDTQKCVCHYCNKEFGHLYFLKEHFLKFHTGKK